MNIIILDAPPGDGEVTDRSQDVDFVFGPSLRLFASQSYPKS